MNCQSKIEIFTQKILAEINAGRDQLTNTLMTLVYKKDPFLFQFLDFNDERTFSEPLLYSYFNAPVEKGSLRSILLGYIKGDGFKEHLEVSTDDNGIIYVPNIGYFLFENPNQKLLLSYDFSTFTFTRSESGIVKYRFEPIVYIPNTQIEICRHNNPYFRSFFTKDSNDGRLLKIEETFEKYTGKLIRAFSLLQENFPICYSLITDSVSKLLMYVSKDQRSFATMQAKGAAFFNVKKDDDEVALLEDITHQCGHNIFYNLLYDKSIYFTTPSDTKLKMFTGKKHDERTVFGAFNALLPYCLSNSCSLLCLENQVFQGKQWHEFIGRFAFRMLKFKLDIDHFEKDGIFTDKGKELYFCFASIFQEIDKRTAGKLDKYDLSNQGYEFSYNNFLTLNPI